MVQSKKDRWIEKERKRLLDQHHGNLKVIEHKQGEIKHCLHRIGLLHRSVSTLAGQYSWFNGAVDFDEDQENLIADCLGEVGDRYRPQGAIASQLRYGIEILEDNAEECRNNLLSVFADFLSLHQNDECFKAASFVTKINIVEADAISMMTKDNKPILFPEWSYLGKGKFQRRDFQFQNLTERSSIQGSLFEVLEESEIFKPVKTYTPMTIDELAHE